MKHPAIKWNPGTREYFCTTCGRTSREETIQDAREQLEQYECEIPSVDTRSPAPGEETVRLMKKSLKHQKKKSLPRPGSSSETPI